ncbi:MAG: hypothetical protein E7012_04265 [Alphaproteobacteria bacterium]|nr:hypothetical protein [Alphaproteobacteria bacterium]
MAKKFFFQKGYRDCIHWVAKKMGYATTQYKPQAQKYLKGAELRGHSSRLAYSADVLAGWVPLNSNKVQIFDTFDDEGGYVCTVWGIVTDKGTVFWQQIGTDKVFESRVSDTKFMLSHCFRLKIGDKLVAVCYRQGDEIHASAVIKEHDYPEYTEEFIDYKFLPCKFSKLINYLEK